MNSLSNKDSVELDISDLILFFWKGRFTLTIFSLLALITSTIFFVFIDKEEIPKPLYEIVIEYEADNIPPKFNPSKVLIDYQKFFYSIQLFDQWKQENPDSKFKYEDLIFQNSIKDKSSLIKNDTNIFIDFGQLKTTDVIIIKSNDISLIYEVIDYLSFINQKLSDHYIKIINFEFKIIKEKVYEINDDTPVWYLDLIIDYERYIEASLSRLSNAIFINNPSELKLLNPQVVTPVYLKLIVFTVLGFILGSIYLFFVNLELPNTKKIKKNKNS